MNRILRGNREFTNLFKENISNDVNNFHINDYNFLFSRRNYINTTDIFFILRWFLIFEDIGKQIGLVLPNNKMIFNYNIVAYNSINNYDLKYITNIYFVIDGIVNKNRNLINLLKNKFNENIEIEDKLSYAYNILGNPDKYKPVGKNLDDKNKLIGELIDIMDKGYILGECKSIEFWLYPILTALVD